MEKFRKTVFVNLVLWALFSLLYSIPAEGKAGDPPLSIKDVKVIDEGEAILLTIHLSQPLREFKAFSLKSPSRIVIDLNEAKYQAPPEKEIAFINLPPVRGIRVGRYPEKVRLVVDLISEKIPSYSVMRGKTELSLRINKIDKKTFPVAPAPPAPPKEAEKPLKPIERPPVREERKPAVPQEIGEKAPPPVEEKPMTDLEARARPPEREMEIKKEIERADVILRDRGLRWEKGDFALALKGYYKNLALGSRTIERDDYFLDLNRLRLDFTGTYKDSLVLKLIYDQEALLGDYLRSAEFRRVKSFERHDLVKLDWEIADRNNLYWKHSLYRAFLRFQSELFNLTLGRQRIAWGTGRFWNPTDIFNPFNPMQIERDERAGVDAIDLEIFLRPMTSFNFVYAPGDSSSRSKGALKFKHTHKDLDVSVLGGKSSRDRILGGDFALTLFDGGLRGEILYHFVPHRKNYYQFILNYDYTFKNTLYVLVEYFHNSGPLSREEFLRTIDRGTSTLTRNLIGVHLGYDITPLLRADLYTIYGVKKAGLFLHPKLRYSVMQNLEVVGGVQWFNRRRGSEFEFDHNLYFIYVQYYF